MSESSRHSNTTKTFGKSTREIPHHSQKAQKWYPVEDEAQPKKVRKTIRACKSRPSLKPGTVLILLAGRFRGKRVILLKNLPQGVLLVTGPFKVNGVPLRRVNARYVIATSYKIDLADSNQEKINEIAGDNYFARKNDERRKKSEIFSKNNTTKPEVGKPAFWKPKLMFKNEQKRLPSSSRAADQKAVDKALLATIKKEPFLISYLGSTFSLRKGDRPHEMAW